MDTELLKELGNLLDTKLRPFNESIVSMKSDIKSINNDITTLNSKVDTLDSKVGELDSKVVSLDSKVSELDSKVVSLDSKVDAIDGKISDIEPKNGNRHMEILLQIDVLKAEIEKLETVTSKNCYEIQYLKAAK